MVEENRIPENGELTTKAKVESLLFVIDDPVSVQRLADVLDVSPGEIESALEELDREYRSGRGIRLQRSGSLVQLITVPAASPYIQRFLGLEAQRSLSQAALEALAIVAYRQPITRPELESIRGVNCDSVLRTLLSFGLIEEVGRADTVGRPILYGSTFEFLKYFGLSSIEELPPLDVSPEELVEGGEEEEAS